MTRPRRAAPGVLLGRYEVLEELGHGGMGVVYRARDKQLNRDVAIKLVVTSQDPSDTLAARLLREAQALAQLSHPNVVAVYDVGRAEGGVFVAMELVAGVAGDVWLKEKRSWRDVLRVFRDAARGLAAAHAVGLVHRDFKPANLILGTDGRVRVLDFGLARTSTPADLTRMGSSDDGTRSSGSHRSLNETSPSLLDVALTEHGAIVGTPPYMAPEQFDSGACDARTDQFSFGVSFYRALYGERPFEGKTFGELKANVMAGRLRAAPAGTDVPAWLRAIVVRCLATDPLQRFASMDAVIDALGHDPDRRKRMIAVGAAAALLAAGAGVVAWRVTRTDPAAACEGGDVEVARVWNPVRKTAVHGAFDATKKPYAAAAYAAIERALDGYTDRWVAMRREACLATRVQGKQSSELLDLRMECLARRLDDVRALVDVFAGADADVVAHAAEAAGALPPLSTCADAEALRAPVRPPADQKLRGRVDAAHRTLAKVRALWIAGRYADARALLDPVVAEAHALAWRPLEAEALLAAARLSEATGDYAMAEKHYKEAAVAAEAGRDDETAALARSGLVGVTGGRLGKYQEAADLALDAAAKIERLGDKELLQANLDQTMAGMLLDQGKYDEAEQRSKHVLEIRQKVLSPDDPSIAAALGELGDVDVQLARNDEAIAYYQKALAVAEKGIGPDHPLCATLRTNLATALRAKGRLPEALVELDRARAISERALGPEHDQLATIAIDTGNVLLDQGKLDDAAAQYRKAAAIWTRALGADHANVATAHFHLGEIALKQHKLDEATADFQRALDIWRARLGNEHPSLAVALSALGDVALAAKKPAVALGHYQRALVILEKALGPSHPELGDTLISAANCELALGKPALAVPLLERALAARESGGDPIDVARAKFILARALAGSDRKRAHTLATEAQAAFTAAGPDHAAEARDVARWLSGSAAR